MTERQMAYALTYSQLSPFYFRSHYVVPNVYRGLHFSHEMDLLAVNPKSRIGTEVEIKVSKSDLKRDAEKKHGHFDRRIRQLYFAVPADLLDAAFEHVPPEAGIITVFRNSGGAWAEGKYQCTVRRRAKPSKYYAEPFTEREITELLRLGNMRYWSVQGKILGKGIE